MTYGPKRPILAMISFSVSGCVPSMRGKLKYLSASSCVTVERSLFLGMLARLGLGLLFVFSPNWTYGPKRPSRMNMGKPDSLSVPIGLFGSATEPSMRRAPVHSGYRSQLMNFPPRPSLMIIGLPHSGHFHFSGAW